MEKENRKSNLRRLLEYAGPLRFLTYASWILSAVSALMALAPFVYIWMILRDIINVAPHFEQAENIVPYGWAALMWAIGSILVYIAALLCSHKAAFRVATNIRTILMHYITKLPMGFVSSIGSGKLRKIVNESSEETETYLAHRLPDNAGGIATPVGLLCMLMYFDWRLGLLSIAPAVLAYGIMYFFMTGRSLRKTMEEYQQALDTMSNEAVEYVRGIPVVKTFGQTVFSFKRFKCAIDRYQQWVIGYTRSLHSPMVAFTTIINSVFAILVAAALFVGTSRERMDGQFLSNLLYYIIITPAMTVMLMRVMYMSQDKIIVESALKRIDSVLDVEPLEEPLETIQPRDNSVELRGVSFRYKDADTDALNDISMTIKAGEHIALVGPSGSGKTTLACLIARFWDTTKGSVNIGGTDVRNIRKDDLMQQVSFVFQDSRLLKGSILDNVRLGRPNATDDEVRRALSEGQCDDIIAKLPEGINTILGSEGTYLSGGEQQRITIARVMLQNTPIVILDEATAYADPDNETRVQAAFNTLSIGKTVIMIAHRLSAVTKADCIYVLKSGRICEKGSHAELTSSAGLYANMWREYNQSINWKLGGTK
jgi:ABC superfamily ATP binding cassette transporter, ABC/membrane protein